MGAFTNQQAIALYTAGRIDQGQGGRPVDI